MAFVAPDVGEVLLLRYMLNNLTPDNARLHLFSSPTSVSENDVLATYTEVTSAGYTSASLTGSLWTITTSSGTTTATYPTQTFTFSTSCAAAGYYLTNNGSSSLILAETFSGGTLNIPTTGGQIQLDVAITLD